MPKKSLTREAKFPKMALVVHSDVGVLSNLQSSLSDKGFTPIIARDLPTALLAITQHYFDLAIVSSRLREGGDGWPLAGVLHLVFPHAFVSVLAPSEDVLTLQSAINYGVKEVYKESSPAADVVSAIMAAVNQGSAKGKPRLQ
jgi:ActR/RegA family two-component response regulator